MQCLYCIYGSYTHPFNGPFSGTTRVSRYQKGKTNLDFTEARDSEWQWQWHQLGHMQVCISLQTDNHNNTPPLSFLQAECPSCHPTNSVKALKGSLIPGRSHSRDESQFPGLDRFQTLDFARVRTFTCMIGVGSSAGARRGGTITDRTQRRSRPMTGPHRRCGRST